MKLQEVIFRTLSYLLHRITATNTLGHGIHSPYLYNIVHFLFYDNHTYYCFHPIEKERERLLRARKQIEVTDFGTGPSGIRTVQSIAKHSLQSPRDAKLLFALAHCEVPQDIIELGTSLGITTAYLASTHSTTQVYTLEGSDSVMEQAQKVWSKLHLKNIYPIVGNIDSTLPELLHTMPQVDFVLMDANHTEQATMRYFDMLLPRCTEQTIIVVDDIYHSRQMHRAWQRICSHPATTACLDLWDMGIVFFKKHLEKRIYKINI